LPAAIPRPGSRFYQEEGEGFNQHSVPLPFGFGYQGTALKRRRIVRTAEVIIETEEKTALSSSQDRHLNLMWCPDCRRKVEMVRPERAAQIACVTTRTLYRWIETETAHFIEDGGRLLICVPALFARTRLKPGAATQEGDPSQNSHDED
jgi:uncharacterized protein YbaR (Trm112 family)